MKLPQLSRMPRHAIEKEDDSLTITIKSRRSIPALLFMFAWLCGITYMMFMVWLIWSAMSLGVMGLLDPELKASPIFGVPFCGFSIFLLIAGVLFFYGVFVFLRELLGKELITVNKHKVTMAFELLGWKRENRLPVEKLKNLVIRNTALRFLWYPIRERYTYAFEINHDGKTYKLGYYVKEEEAKEILSTIQSFISLAP